MAQLVEHIVHIDGVTGSSPVGTTIQKSLEVIGLSRLFCYQHKTKEAAVSGILSAGTEKKDD